MKNLILILILVIFAQITFSTRTKGRDRSFLRSQCKDNGKKCKDDSECCSSICSKNNREFSDPGKFCRH